MSFGDHTAVAAGRVRLGKTASQMVPSLAIGWSHAHGKTPPSWSLIPGGRHSAGARQLARPEYVLYVKPGIKAVLRMSARGIKLTATVRRCGTARSETATIGCRKCIAERAKTGVGIR